MHTFGTGSQKPNHEGDGKVFLLRTLIRNCSWLPQFPPPGSARWVQAPNVTMLFVCFFVLLLGSLTSTCVNALLCLGLSQSRTPAGCLNNASPVNSCWMFVSPESDASTYYLLSQSGDSSHLCWRLGVLDLVLFCHLSAVSAYLFLAIDSFSFCLPHTQ